MGVDIGAWIAVGVAVGAVASSVRRTVTVEQFNLSVRLLRAHPCAPMAEPFYRDGRVDETRVARLRRGAARWLIGELQAGPLYD